MVCINFIRFLANFPSSICGLAHSGSRPFNYWLGSGFDVCRQEAVVMYHGILLSPPTSPIGYFRVRETIFSRRHVAVDCISLTTGVQGLLQYVLLTVELNGEFQIFGTYSQQ